jgi:hypothetical protein
MNVTNIPKGRMWKAAAALELLKSIGVPQKQISMVAGGVLDREEAREKASKRRKRAADRKRRAGSRKGKR